MLVVVFGLQWESVTRKYEWNSLDIFIVWNSSCDKNNFLLSRESRFLFLSLSVFSLGAALSALFLLRYYVTSQNGDMLFSHWTEDSPITILFSAILSLAFTHTHDNMYVFSDITAATWPQLMSTRTYFIWRWMWLSPFEPKWKCKYYVPLGWWNWTERDVSYENIIKTTTIKFQIQEFIIPLMGSSCRKQMMKKEKN